MLTHQELINKRRELETKKVSLEYEANSKRSVRDSYLSQISNIARDESLAIDKAKNEALNQAIEEATFKYSNLIVKLNKSKDEMIANRDRRVNAITYDEYSKDGYLLSVDDYVTRSEELRLLLEKKHGVRLSKALEGVIPTANGAYNSLEDISLDFDELDRVSNKLTDDADVLSKLESFIFTYNTEKLNGNSSYVFIIVVILIGLLLLLASPIFIILLCLIIGYNLFKSYSFYNSMRIIKNILPNVTKIKQSIESGIKTKMNSDKVKIENKFKTMIDDVDRKIDQLDDKIAEVTESVASDFTFNSFRVSDSFKIKENSLKDRIEIVSKEYDNLMNSIPEVDKEILEIDRQIIELGKTIYYNYYPRDLSDIKKSYSLINDVLIDVLDNKPSLHTLPKGSTLYVYNREEDVFSFLALFVASLYIRMEVSSFYIDMLDIIYVGTKFIRYTALDNFTPSISNEEIKEVITSLRSEMLKRVDIIGNQDIEKHNQMLLDDESATIPYRVVFDMFNKPNQSDDVSRQIIKNGYKYGIYYNLFLSEKDLISSKDTMNSILQTYDNIYFISSTEIKKKSKRFYENLIEKR